MPALTNAKKAAQRYLLDWFTSPSGLGICILGFLVSVFAAFQYGEVQ